LTEWIMTAPRWTAFHAATKELWSEEIGPVMPSRKFFHGTPE
jgi:hypothetical protein